MPYVNRDAQGNINGLVRWPDSDDHEFLPDDAPEVVAFLTPPAPPTATELTERRFTTDPAFSRLIEYIAGTEGRSARAVLDDIKAKQGRI